MPIDPPSLASWPAGAINYAFVGAAADIRDDALVELNKWLAEQTALILGTETTEASNRTICFKMEASILSPLWSITFFPPPIHAEPLSGDVLIATYLDLPAMRASGELARMLLHELGHALGFDHTALTDSIMYVPIKATATFSPDDLASIHSVYGTPGTGGSRFDEELFDTFVFDAEEVQASAPSDEPLVLSCRLTLDPIPTVRLT